MASHFLAMGHPKLLIDIYSPAVYVKRAVRMNTGVSVAQANPVSISKIGILAPIKHDHSSQKKRMARIKGQIDGIERMMIDGRYCPDIIQQIKAVRSALKGLEMGIFETHVKGCVRKAFGSKSVSDSDKKIDELLLLMKSHS